MQKQKSTTIVSIVSNLASTLLKHGLFYRCHWRSSFERRSFRSLEVVTWTALQVIFFFFPQSLKIFPLMLIWEGLQHMIAWNYLLKTKKIWPSFSSRWNSQKCLCSAFLYNWFWGIIRIMLGTFFCLFQTFLRSDPYTPCSSCSYVGLRWNGAESFSTPMPKLA
jgi:hypothetical protein